MFYTLASCNENACGMPNHIREEVAELIDKGMTDKQIFDALKKSQGPLMARPHLLP
jgi:cytochrome c-type biogenesis protein CcmH/NrfF